MIAVLLAALALQSPVPATGPSAPSDGVAVAEAASQAAATLDRMHQAAAHGDGAAYFAQFAPDARFIGTDASERWSLDQFHAYADPVFARGRGWTYHPRERALTTAGDLAWFDEILDHDAYGVLRGSGVLRRRDGVWKIEQYVLSFAVPNDRAEAVVDVIREAGEAP